MGYEFGQKAASDSRKEIQKAKKSELGMMAGARLRMVVATRENAIHRTESWQIGFFEGFLSRCEEVRGE